MFVFFKKCSVIPKNVLVFKYLLCLCFEKCSLYKNLFMLTFIQNLCFRKCTGISKHVLISKKFSQLQKKNSFLKKCSGFHFFWSFKKCPTFINCFQVSKKCSYFQILLRNFNVRVSKFILEYGEMFSFQEIFTIFKKGSCFLKNSLKKY